MSKKIVAALIIIGVITFFYAIKLPCPISSYKSKISLGGQEINVKVARTQSARSKGLSGKTNLEENSGMLFVFDEDALHPMWMRDMNFPLDILWINKEGEIVHIEKNLLPCARGTNMCPIHQSPVPARYVLELNAGWTNKYQIQIGDKVLYL